MKPMASVVLYGLLVGWMSALGAAPVEGAQKHGEHRRAAVVQRGGTQASVQVVFSPAEVRVLREYYAPRYRTLPPGLQKKLRRTGRLPPGWQKKFEPFPVAIERQLVALPPGYSRGVLEGRAVIFNQRTQVLFDVVVLF